MRKLDSIAKQNIRTVLAGLVGKPLRAAVLGFAERYKVTASQIYAASRDVRPTRTRSDKGRRAADLLADEALSTVTEYVVTANHNLLEAIRQAEKDGHKIKVAASTLARYLREHGVSPSQLKRASALTPRRRFEAEYPGQVVQCDWSTVKEQWIDTESRRTLRLSKLDVSENHPNVNPRRIKIWKAVAIDDYSRRCWVRFYACLHPSSIETVDFLDLVVSEGGVFEKLYTDRDSLFACQHVGQFLSLLNPDGPSVSVEASSSKSSLLEQHAAGNAAATGKCERLNRKVGEMERRLGIVDVAPTLEELQTYAVEIENELNWRRHGTTNEIPMLRWRRDLRPLRRPTEEYRAIMRARKFEDVVVSPYVTVAVPGQGEFQLPRKRPYVDWISRAVTVVWPEGDKFFVVGPDGKGHEFDRVKPIINQIGDYSGPQETTGQQVKKVVRKQAAVRRRARKEAGTPKTLLVGGNEHPTLMPKRAEEFDGPLVVSAPPVILDPPTVFPIQHINRFTFFEAVETLQTENLFAVPPSADERTWLRDLFGDREQIDETELRRALAARTAPKRTHLRRA